MSAGGGSRLRRVQPAVLAAVGLVLSHDARVLELLLSGHQVDRAKETTPAVRRVGEQARLPDEMRARLADLDVGGRFGQEGLFRAKLEHVYYLFIRWKIECIIIARTRANNQIAIFYFSSKLRSHAIDFDPIQRAPEQRQRRRSAASRQRCFSDSRRHLWHWTVGSRTLGNQVHSVARHRMDVCGEAGSTHDIHQAQRTKSTTPIHHRPRFQPVGGRHVEHVVLDGFVRLQVFLDVHPRDHAVCERWRQCWNKHRKTSIP